MMRQIIACLTLLPLLLAVEPDELPRLAYDPLPALPGGQAVAGAGATGSFTPANAPIAPPGQTGPPQIPLNVASGAVGGNQAPSALVTPGISEAAIDPNALLIRRWNERAALPPRLAANLFARSAPTIRPIAADYRLKPGDVMRIVAWGGQPVNERVPVAPNGDLAVPNFGLVPVSGATVGEAQQRVLELVRSQFRQGGAILAVEQPSAQAVTVAGEVAKPGYLVLPPGGTVLEALSAAGGILPRGSLRSIRITVGKESKELDLYRIAVDGDASALVPLEAGALVFVPLSGPQVQVFGAVQRMSGIELRLKETLGEALRLAGGLSAEADPATLRLLREGAHGQVLSQMPVEELAALTAQDGDRILVSLRRDLAGASGGVTVRGAVRSPGVYPMRPGLTLDQTIAEAGGLLPIADAGRIRVQRLLAEPQSVVVDGVPTTVHHATLVAPPGASSLAALDEIIVPERPKPNPSRSGVSISGSVGKPGVYAFTPGMTIRDLVLTADGLLPGAQVDRVDLVRSSLGSDGARTAQTIPIDLRPVLEGKDQGMGLQSGDAVIIRSTSDARVRVSLSGHFRNTGVFTVPSGTTLGQLVALAGGIEPEAFPRGAKVFRVQEAEAAKQFINDLIRRAEVALAISNRASIEADEEAKDEASRNIARQEADLAQLRKSTATGRMAGIDLEGILAKRDGADIVLQDGDKVELPAKPGTVRILGEIMMPCSQVFAEGLSARELIRRSGGFTRQADQDSVFVVRADGSVVATAQGDTLAWDYERRRWARASLSSLKLLEGDAVIIPADVRYQDSTRRVVRDWTQIMFQVAATVGTIAVLGQ